MARFTRLQVLAKMEEVGVIPVFYNGCVDTAKRVVSACAKAGAFVVEFTNRGDNAIEVFIEMEKYATKEHPEMILGVGSIVDAYTAAMYINSGASFVVGPSFDEEAAIVCNKRKIAYCPGCATATEIQTAHSFGVEIVKIFPGGLVGGPEFVKAVKGPMPYTSIMPTGGVSPTRESLTKWFESGITCAGIGSNLIRKDLLEESEEVLTAHIKETMDLVFDVRSKIKK